MKFDRFKHHRQSIRLKGYDYAQAGAYFVTICIQGRLSLLGEIAGSGMIVNAAGLMVEEIWLSIPDKFPTIQLDAFIVMPNHVHFILIIANSDDQVRVDPRVHPNPDAGAIQGQTQGSAPTRPSLSRIIQWYKSLTTARYRIAVRENNWPPFNRRLWQRNYYEHIIRNERALIAIRNYIRNNPANWPQDQLHSARPKRK